MTKPSWFRPIHVVVMERDAGDPQRERAVTVGASWPQLRAYVRGSPNWRAYPRDRWPRRAWLWLRLRVVHD
jgi:hypothetical protein